MPLALDDCCSVQTLTICCTFYVVRQIHNKSKQWSLSIFVGMSWRSVMVCLSVCLSVCPVDTRVSPAKKVNWSKCRLGETRLIPSNHGDTYGRRLANTIKRLAAIWTISTITASTWSNTCKYDWLGFYSCSEGRLCYMAIAYLYRIIRQRLTNHPFRNSIVIANFTKYEVVIIFC